MQVRKQQLKPDIKKMDWFLIEKGVCQGYIYCHPAYVTYIQNIPCKMLAWINHKLESELPGEISTTSDMQMTLRLWQKVKN